MVEIGWLQVESVLLGTLNWMPTSLLGLFFQALSVLHILFLKSLRYASFLWPFWIEYTSNFLSCINLQKNQIWKQRKDLKTFELKNSNNLISSQFRSPWHHPRQDGKNNFLNQNSNYKKKMSAGPNILFDLNDFSNYGSLNYRSFVITVY